MEKNIQENNIDFYSILHDIWKEIGIVLAVAVSMAFLSYIAMGILDAPTYTSSTTFVVSPKGSVKTATENMESAQKMASSVTSVMQSDILKKRVCENMKIPRFPGTVGVNVLPETNLLTVSVTSEDPKMAFSLLKEIMRSYPELGEKVLGEVVLDIFEEPSYPSRPDHPRNSLKIMFLAFTGFFVITAGGLGVYSIMRDTVKNEKELPLKLDTTAFGILHHEKNYKNFRDRISRKKKRILLSDPAVSFNYGETVKKICTRLLHRMDRKNAKVVMITSTESGEGKSTVAMNLAQAMAMRGKHTLLVEGDLKKPGLAECMNLNKKGMISWGSRIRKKDVEEAMFQPDGFKCTVLFNNEKVSNSTELLSSESMKKILENWKEKFDVIIIDAPSVNKRSDAEVLAGMTDFSLLVVKQNFAKVPLINDAIDLLNSYGSELLGCVFNDVLNRKEVFTLSYGDGYGYSYGYGKYGKYGKYGQHRKTVDDETSEESEDEYV